VLLFKKKFLPAIRSGEKTQTIRLWSVCRMKAGQRSYIPGAGYIRVVSVDAVELPALSDEDARPDGFPTADALRQELTMLYAGALAAGHRAYRVRFELLSSEEQAAAIAARQAAKAAAKASGTATNYRPGPESTEPHETKRDSCSPTKGSRPKLSGTRTRSVRATD